MRNSPLRSFRTNHVYCLNWIFNLVEMHPICSLQRHHRLTNGVTITQALRCQSEKGWWVLWENNRFFDCLLELPCPWLPVHLGSSRLDSMHFVRMILSLGSCNNLRWFAFARQKVNAANSRNKFCGQTQVACLSLTTCREIFSALSDVSALYRYMLLCFGRWMLTCWGVTTIGFPAPRWTPAGLILVSIVGNWHSMLPLLKLILIPQFVWGLFRVGFELVCYLSLLWFHELWSSIPLSQ